MEHKSALLTITHSMMSVEVFVDDIQIGVFVMSIEAPFLTFLRQEFVSQKASFKARFVKKNKAFIRKKFKRKVSDAAFDEIFSGAAEMAKNIDDARFARTMLGRCWDDDPLNDLQAGGLFVNAIMAWLATRVPNVADFSVVQVRLFTQNGVAFNRCRMEAVPRMIDYQARTVLLAGNPLLSAAVMASHLVNFYNHGNMSQSKH